MTAPFRPRDHAWHPPARAPSYRSSLARAPSHPLVAVPQGLSELTGPVFGADAIGPLDGDLLRNFAGADAPVGERILLHGRVLDEDARPVPHVLVEIWQANAGGRYRHKTDGYLAPLDPNFGGCGRCLTDAEGQFRFRTVRPGPYPFQNHEPAWRPAHVHFSVFGSGLAQRLITQMYFEGDPLIAKCPIVATIPDARAVERLIARLDMENAVDFEMLAYRFDIVLRGRTQTHFENRREGA
ncbi:protocatechuate 3,4-dioxygenase subunit beta [Maritimibacter sp. 55A14]|uniref:protocatechuate 3,4-dioxygenase subunit beta n=1 Tax=Maritimibacter sp. 55A14 TaxID=2174844 RepID=UPI000D61DF20|nr:protocatechuate 3,4-dioxygenase subunit beta [Maritimibacter sp. 55A14]PWE33451.1 protocatechuate 3,4-dioxygenase subunit beta [Maritimibacter sp. 55A14]